MNATSENTNNLVPISCDRFNRCSANICPLDLKWQERKHLNGERICFYLTEAQKINAKAIFECGGRGYVYSLIHEVTPAIISRHYVIQYALKQAKNSGSRISRKIGATHGTKS